MGNAVTVEKLEKFVGKMASRLLSNAGLQSFSIAGNPVDPDTVASSSYLLPSVVHRADVLCRTSLEEPFGISYIADENALLGAQVEAGSVMVADSVFLAFCRGALDEAVQNHLSLAQRAGVELSGDVPLDDLVMVWGQDVSSGLISIRQTADVDVPRLGS